jgi:hypothetical protein
MEARGFDSANERSDIYTRSIRNLKENCSLDQGRRQPRGQRGQLPPLPKQCGDSTGATGFPFYRNCTSKFVRYSQEFEIMTILKQCLSNLCFIFNQLQ